MRVSVKRATFSFSKRKCWNVSEILQFFQKFILFPEDFPKFSNNIFPTDKVMLWNENVGNFKMFHFFRNLTIVFQIVPTVPTVTFRNTCNILKSYNCYNFFKMLQLLRNVVTVVTFSKCYNSYNSCNIYNIFEKFWVPVTTRAIPGIDGHWRVLSVTARYCRVVTGIQNISKML